MRNARTVVAWGVALLLLLLVGLITTSTSRPREQVGLGELDAHSSEPDGALALYLWSQKLGRDTEYLEYRPFDLRGEHALLVALQPEDPFEPEQLRELSGWLREGGSLLLGTDTSHNVRELLTELDLSLGASDNFTVARPAQPLLLQPPVARVTGSGRHTLAVREGVPVLAAHTAKPEPVLVTRKIGEGQVWVLSMPNVLSNGSLANDDNAEIYLNVLEDARPGKVLFDEYHHGRPDAVSLRTLLLSERWGWAVLYTGLAVLCYTVLRGKRLGRPIRLPATRTRDSGEYVRSLASLLRRAKKSEYLHAHYYESLLGSLRHAAGLPVGSDVETLARAAAENTGAPTGKVLAALMALQRGDIDEKQLLRLVREAEHERRALRRRVR